MSVNDETMRQWMRAAQSGDKKAYAQLLDASQIWLKRYYARKISPAILDDLVQETLVSVHRKRATYDPDRAFLPWLAAIGRYRWIDYLRKYYRQDETELNEDVLSAPQSDDVESKLSLERLLLLIPHAQAEVIRLVKITGLSISEASEQTGQSESLVKVNIHRGLKKMSAAIEDV